MNHRCSSFARSKMQPRGKSTIALEIMFFLSLEIGRKGIPKPEKKTENCDLAWANNVCSGRVADRRTHACLFSCRRSRRPRPRSPWTPRTHPRGTRWTLPRHACRLRRLSRRHCLRLGCRRRLRRASSTVEDRACNQRAHFVRPVSSSKGANKYFLVSLADASAT